jgi:hypothetical protein
VRVDNYIRTYDTEIRYQVGLGPIWAKGKKMTVYNNVITSLKNKEAKQSVARPKIERPLKTQLHNCPRRTRKADPKSGPTKANPQNGSKKQTGKKSSFLPLVYAGVTTDS